MIDRWVWTHRYPDIFLPPMWALIPGGLYRICSRNLEWGVWDGLDSFWGIREKFGNSFIDSEFHWDYDGRGTVRTAEYAHERVPLELLAYGSHALYNYLAQFHDTPPKRAK